VTLSGLILVLVLISRPSIVVNFLSEHLSVVVPTFHSCGRYFYDNQLMSNINVTRNVVVLLLQAALEPTDNQN